MGKKGEVKEGWKDEKKKKKRKARALLEDEMTR